MNHDSDTIKYLSSECSCDECKKMCINPCYGTPEEMKKLIDNGLGEYLTVIRVAKELHGGRDWFVICPTNSNDPKKFAFSICAFQDTSTRLCMLHDLGAKPLEGRLAHHSFETHIDPNGECNRTVIERMWDNEEAQRMVFKFLGW